MYTLYFITTNDKSIPEDKRSDTIKQNWEYKDNKWYIDQWNINDDYRDNDIKVRRTFEEKFEYLIYSIINRNAEIVLTKGANKAAKFLTDIIKKYVPEFEGYYWPIHRSNDGLYVKDLNTDIYLEDDVIIHSKEYDDSIFTWLKDHDISIEDFLFNDKYFIMKVGYDAVNNIKTMFKTNIIDKSIIVNIDEINSELNIKGDD